MTECILAFFFFNDTATTEIYTLSLHDALPISSRCNTKRSSTSISRMNAPKATHAQTGNAMAHLLSRRAAGTPKSEPPRPGLDRKSTRLNSRHANISYAVFCLKKKKHTTHLLQL